MSPRNLAVGSLVLLLAQVAVHPATALPVQGHGNHTDPDLSSSPDEPQSCIDKAKELCNHCHLSKSCWESCARDHEDELRAAGCVVPPNEFTIANSTSRSEKDGHHHRLSMCTMSEAVLCGWERLRGDRHCMACVQEHSRVLMEVDCHADDFTRFCDSTEQLPGCLGDFNTSVPFGERGIIVRNEFPHEIFVEMLSCDPSKGDANCHHAFKNRLGELHLPANVPVGAGVPVSVCLIPAGRPLFIPVPTDFEIDSFKMYVKWDHCDGDGENCKQHQEHAPCEKGCATPGTAIEATFSVPSQTRGSNFTNIREPWVSDPNPFTTDNIDCSYVDAVTVAASLKTIDDTTCTKSHRCNTDMDCAAQPGSRCVDRSNTGAQKYCIGAINESVNVSFAGCPTSITLSGDDHTYTDVDLRVCVNQEKEQVACTDDGSTTLTACVSPKSWLTDQSVPNGAKLPLDRTSDIADRYACEGKYHDDKVCRDASPGNNHCATSSSCPNPSEPNEYVRWVHSESTGVYAWAYDDDLGDFSCNWGGDWDAKAPSYEWVVRPA